MKGQKTRKTTRFVAIILAIILVFSSMAVMTTVSASAKSLSSSNSDVETFIDIGIDNIATAMSTGDPYSATARLLAGAFKLFIAGTSSDQPSTQDIMNKLNEIQSQLTNYYNQEKSLLDKIDIKIDEIQFKDYMNDLLSYNQDAMSILSALLDENVPDDPTEETTDIASPDEENKSREEKLRDLYTQVTKYTTDHSDYMHASDVIGKAITSGGVYDKAFVLYEKELRKTTDNADEIREQLESFAKLCTGQFIISYTCRLTGYSAQNKLYTMDENEAGLKALEALAGTKYNEAKAVTDEYQSLKEGLGTIEKCKVNNGTKTTPYASFADAWVDVSKMSGDITITLSQDIIIDEGSDYRYDLALKQGETSCFKDGNLYINNSKLNLTIDFNGYTVKRDEVNSPSFIFDNTTVTFKNGYTDGIKAIHSNLTLNKIKLSGNCSTGLYAEYTPINLYDCTFTGYTDSAIKSYYYKSVIDSCTFRDNKGSNGAGIYIKNAESEITSCVFADCAASSNGGGIYATGSDTKVSNSNFGNCSANNGGGMYCNQDAIIDSCNFSSCSAKDDGGAYCQGYFGDGFTSNFKLTACDFFHNHANDDGGAIYADSMSYAKLENIDCQFNTAGSDGAGMYCQKGSGSACDPDMYGVIKIINNTKDNGTNSNLFLGENTTSKCIVHFHSVDRTNSKIGVTSPTNDDDLDITGKQDVDYSSVFTYDTNKYKIHGYKGFFGGRYVEIVKR